MYIYESHMGGLYATDEAQNWEEMYCETCGDSDWELGTADTVEEAWNMFKDDTEGCGVCDRCPHAEGDDDTFCDNCQHDGVGFGTWDLLYMMRFLYGNFECENPSFVYVIPHQGDSVYVDFQKNGKETYNLLPSSFCVEPELKDLIAERLELKVKSALDWDTEDSYSTELKFVTRMERENDTIYIYELEVNYALDAKIGVAGYNGKCWAGFIPEETLKLYGRDKVVWEYFQKKGAL